MLTIPAPAAVNGDALAVELAAVGLPNAQPVLIADQLRVNAPDTRRADVEKVLAAHTGQPLPLPAEQQADEDARAQLTALRAKARDVLAGNSTFTAAQLQKIAAHLVLRATR